MITKFTPLATTVEGTSFMRKIIEYTLISADGVFAGTDTSGFFEYRDEAYLRDGLGQLLACDAMLMGRTTYENFARIWPGRIHPWAERINSMPKYVFSSTLQHAEWNNSTITQGDVVSCSAESLTIELSIRRSRSDVKGPFSAFLLPEHPPCKDVWDSLCSRRNLRES